MKGTILGLNVEGSVIVLLGNDDRRYHLPQSEWKSNCSPAVGMKVDFIADGDSVKEAFYIPEIEKPTSQPKALSRSATKSRAPLLLLLPPSLRSARTLILLTLR